MFFTRDKSFYKTLVTLAIPIALQNAVTFAVGLADNVMIGTLGDSAISGVYVGSQLQTLLQMFIGGIEGAILILAAQYWGKRDTKSIRRIAAIGVRFALLIGLVITATAFLLPSQIVSLFTSDASVIEAGTVYVRVVSLSYIFFCISQVMVATMRAVETAKIGLYVSFVTLIVNVVCNYILIFGKLGFPAMGVRGAAIATVLSRFVELAIVATGAHRSADRYPFMRGVYHSLAIPGVLVKSIFIRSMPLLANELMWGAGQAVLLQCYSVRGIQAIAAMNITSTITQIFNEVFLSLGNATAILVGQELGASRMTGARRTAWRMITLSVSSCAVMGTLLALFSPLIPHIYNTEPAIRELASSVIRTAALCMPLFAFANAAYFTLRSGGKTLITFFFDSCYTWLINFPIAFVLSRYTALPLPIVYLFVNGVDLLKCIIGFILVKKGVWVNNIVASSQDVPQAD